MHRKQERRTGGTDQYVHIQETKPSCMCCCLKKLEVYVCSMFKDVCVGVGWRHCYMTGGLWHMYGDHSHMEESKAVMLYVPLEVHVRLNQKAMYVSCSGVMCVVHDACKHVCVRCSGRACVCMCVLTCLCVCLKGSPSCHSPAPLVCVLALASTSIGDSTCKTSLPSSARMNEPLMMLVIASR